MKFHLLLLALCAGYVAAFAQTPSEPDDTTSYAGYEMLDEVVVKAQKPIMQTDGAKLTYNVEEDPAAGSSSAMDMLKKVPQVSVDGDGNVRLNGDTNFKFQMNGLENPMLKQYSKQIFEGMPASAIVKIEVITEPGAKEDAEGSAGIINIITERSASNTSSGFSGTATLQVTNHNFTPSIYGVVKKDKFTLSANVSYQRWAFMPQRGQSESTVSYIDSAEEGSLNTIVSQKARFDYVGGNLNMSWEPNSSNLFNAGVNAFYLDGDLFSLNSSSRRYGAASDGAPLLWAFDQKGSGNLSIFNISANASYRHNFGHDSNYLVLSYLFNYGDTPLTIDRHYDNMEDYTTDYLYESQKSTTFNRGHTVQADYANNFNSKHHLMEVGVKGIFRHNTALSDYYYGKQAEDLVKFPLQSSNLMQPQNIYAAYASYTGSFGNFGVIGGLRYEHTVMGVTERINSMQHFRNHLNDWVPNAALTWSFSPASNLRLAYQMRISRPSIEQVNPFELSFTPYEVRRGNTDLTSERSHILSLKYSSFGRVAGGTIGVEYNRSDNAISSYSFLEQRDGINTLVTFFANIGKRQDVALTGLFTWSIIKGMNIALNGRLAYNTLKAPSEGYRNHGWSGNIGGNWNYTVAEVYKFSAYGAWNSRSVSIQGYGPSFYYYGLSAARDFLADKSLTLSVSANNFLQKDMKYVSHTESHNAIYDNVGKNLNSWTVGISLSWKFGSLKAQVKKTGVEITNDDINSASNKSQGGGL